MNRFFERLLYLGSLTMIFSEISHSSSKGDVKSKRSIFDDPNEEEFIYINSQECGRALPTARIANGIIAQEGQFPWMVRILSSTWGKTQACGATLITRQHLLTAAHCTKDGAGQDVTAITAIYGSTNEKKGSKVEVIAMLRPQYFDINVGLNDIAILLLQRPLQLSWHVVPICLPMTPIYPIGSKLTTAGWGMHPEGRGRKDFILRYTTVLVLENSICYYLYKQYYYDPGTLYCASGNNTGFCKGDSGGPLMATTTDGRALQVGVTSYGPNCHRAEWTGVYTSVDAFAEWIGFYIADQSQYTWLKLPQGGPGEV